MIILFVHECTCMCIWLLISVLEDAEETVSTGMLKKTSDQIINFRTSARAYDQQIITCLLLISCSVSLTTERGWHIPSYYTLSYIPQSHLYSALHSVFCSHISLTVIASFVVCTLLTITEWFSPKKGFKPLNKASPSFKRCFDLNHPFIITRFWIQEHFCLLTNFWRLDNIDCVQCLILLTSQGFRSPQWQSWGCPSLSTRTEPSTEPEPHYQDPGSNLQTVPRNSVCNLK